MYQRAPQGKELRGISFFKLEKGVQCCDKGSSPRKTRRCIWVSLMLGQYRLNTFGNPGPSDLGITIENDENKLILNPSGQCGVGDPMEEK